MGENKQIEQKTSLDTLLFTQNCSPYYNKMLTKKGM